MATPGHTSDSVSFLVDPDPAVLTGDTILGRGTTVVAHPDGDLGEYLESLRRLRDLGDVPALTGHGPELASVAQAAQFYLDHRAERLQQVRDALALLGPDATPRQVVEVVYADVDRSVWWAAELSVRAQLDYLARSVE
jgi:glyoxylase-like metal-dependent hydrolase (beta-lactamase superfamily II)